MSKRETRVLPGGVQLRDVNGAQYFTGRAIVYNSYSHPIGGWFRERIMPGAFDEYLADKPDVFACINHDPARILGRTSAGTLTLTRGDEGIDAQVPVSELSYARDLAISIGRGDIRGMSFCFEIDTDDWYMKDGERCRDVIKGKIFEVSWVTDPAYPQTEAAMRSFERWAASRRGRNARRLELNKHR